jgi:class 3 adenylate cyclase
MECQKCQTENPEENKFCRECGAKLLSACPQCGAEVFPTDKFCGKCGQKLAESIETVGRTPSVDSERKHVTILFSDLSGYTAMTEKLDPEDVKDIMSRIFGDISQVVTRYEGFIEKFIGDAVMALFGVPKIHEDDAVRAIRAAREIHHLVKSLSPELEERVGRPLSMHTGINTGLVVTGEVHLESGTLGVAGDALNVASRLSSVAGADEIVVGHETFRQAMDFFEFERKEPIQVKGKSKPLAVYRVVSTSEEPGTFRRFSILKAKLIGRMAEMDELTEIRDF